MLVSVIQAVITRNQLLGRLGGNSHLTWLSMNSLYLPKWIELELEPTGDRGLRCGSDTYMHLCMLSSEAWMVSDSYN